MQCVLSEKISPFSWCSCLQVQRNPGDTDTQPQQESHFNHPSPTVIHCKVPKSRLVVLFWENSLVYVKFPISQHWEIALDSEHLGAPSDLSISRIQQHLPLHSLSVSKKLNGHFPLVRQKTRINKKLCWNIILNLLLSLGFTCFTQICLL